MFWKSLPEKGGVGKGGCSSPWGWRHWWQLLLCRSLKPVLELPLAHQHQDLALPTAWKPWRDTLYQTAQQTGCLKASWATATSRQPTAGQRPSSAQQGGQAPPHPPESLLQPHLPGGWCQNEENHNSTAHRKARSCPGTNWSPALPISRAMLALGLLRSHTQLCQESLPPPNSASDMTASLKQEGRG